MVNLILNKKRAVILFLIIIAVVSVLWIYFKSRNQKVGTLPTPISRVFELSGVAPKNGVDATIIPTTAIEFLFNKSINPNTLIITIDPKIEFGFEVTENRRGVFIRPIPSWKIGQDYIMTIKVESDEGEKISEIKYPLRLKKIIESDFNEVF